MFKSQNNKFKISMKWRNCHILTIYLNFLKSKQIHRSFHVMKTVNWIWEGWPPSAILTGLMLYSTFLNPIHHPQPFWPCHYHDFSSTATGLPNSHVLEASILSGKIPVQFINLLLSCFISLSYHPASHLIVFLNLNKCGRHFTFDYPFDR